MMWNILKQNASSDPSKDPFVRVIELATSLKQRLKSDWQLVTPLDETRSRGVVRLLAPRSGQEESLYQYIYDRNNIAGSGGGPSPEKETFRLCPHVYNTMKDLDRAISGMKDWQGR